MRRCWYTIFLIVSLVIYIVLPDKINGYVRAENMADLQAEMETEAAEQAGTEESVDSSECTETEQAEDAENVPALGQGAAEPEEPAENVEALEQGTIESGEDIVPAESEQTVSAEEGNADMTATNALFPEHFADVLFVGDSRTVGLYEYGQLEEADVFADSGMTGFNLWSSELSFDGQGKKTLEQVLTEKQYRTIHFMLGINELGYSMNQVVEKYRAAVEKIQMMQPDAQVVLGANLHVTAAKSASSNIYNNQQINELNMKIQKIGEELGCYYVDINEVFDDAQGCLAKEYTTDGSHVLGIYYADWVQWLKNKNRN